MYFFSVFTMSCFYSLTSYFFIMFFIISRRIPGKSSQFFSSSLKCFFLFFFQFHVQNNFKKSYETFFNFLQIQFLFRRKSFFFTVAPFLMVSHEMQHIPLILSYGQRVLVSRGKIMPFFLSCVHFCNFFAAKSAYLRN